MESILNYRNYTKLWKVYTYYTILYYSILHYPTVHYTIESVSVGKVIWKRLC